jgi:hypothetical protein
MNLLRFQDEHAVAICTPVSPADVSGECGAAHDASASKSCNVSSPVHIAQTSEHWQDVAICRIIRAALAG